jgi:methylthioribulose-1-phosphate dehydratase
MSLAAQMVKTIHFLYARGWAPATSSNYSFRIAEENEFYVSESGIDKGEFAANHFLKVSAFGIPIADVRKPSAETALHSTIYELFPHVHCVLHTHTVLNTILSQYFANDKCIQLKNYEILKGFEGIKTHEVSLKLPIFDNTQNISVLANQVSEYAKQNSDIKAFLITGHGMYTWGSTIADAKRHVEVIEFLLECEYKKLCCK